MNLKEAGEVFVTPAAYADEARFHEACSQLRRDDPIHLTGFGSHKHALGARFLEPVVGIPNFHFLVGGVDENRDTFTSELHKTRIQEPSGIGQVTSCGPIGLAGFDEL